MNQKITIERPTSVFSGVGALFISFLLLQVGNGLQRILLPLRAESEGISAGSMGLVMAFHFAGYLIGARFIIVAINTVGHVRVFAALASTASIAVLVNAVFVVPASWMIVYLISGICNAGIFVVLESWLNAKASNEDRGKVLGTYMMIMMGGTAAGFLMVNLGDASGFRMFIFSSVLISSAVIPVALTATSVPPLQEEERMKLGELFNIIPAAVVGLFLASFVQASTSSMSTVYGTEAGMSTEKVALFTAAGFVGAVLLQFPLGALSDRFPRRSVIIGATVIAGLLALMGALTSATGSWIVLIHLSFGAFVFPLYGLFLALANDWIPLERRTAAASALVLVSSLGAVVSPIITAQAINFFGPSGFYWSFVAVFTILFIYLTYRVRVREAVPIDRQSPFRPIVARSGQIFHIVSRRIRTQDQSRES